MKDALLLLRPHQWLKNLFVFLPLFFGGHLLEAACLRPAVLVFLAYCFAASGVYCLNDIHDAASDRLHPKKCRRPIASGAVSRAQGYVLMLVCLALSLAVIVLGRIHVAAACVIVLYIAMNTAYCLALKHVALLDVFVIAMGFVLRILAGGLATGIVLSHWIVLMTFLLSLFLALGKRRDDMLIYETSGVTVRDTLHRYSLAFINQAIAIVASVTIVCYIMYTVSPDVTERFHSIHVYATSLFVLAGIFRYLQLTIVDAKSGSPTEVLLKDRFIHACIAGWVAVFVIILYF